MNHSETIDKLAEALAKAQAAMTNVNKASRAKIATKAGGEYSYTYADLGDVYEMIRKPLADNGLSILQAPAVNGNSVEVETVIAHTSGQWASCTVSMAIDTRDPKAVGSAITYGRRYGMSLIGVVTDDDDDGHTASKPAASPRRNEASTPVQKPAQEKQPIASAPTNGNGHDADAEFAALPKAPQSMADDIPPATENQIKALGIICRELYPKAEDMEKVRVWMQKTYGVESRKDLNRDQAADMLRTLDKQKNGIA